MRRARTRKTFGRKSKDGALKFEVAKLVLHDGDILVVRTEMILTVEQCVHIRERVQESVGPGVRVMLLTAGLSLAVIEDRRKKSRGKV